MTIDLSYPGTPPPQQGWGPMWTPEFPPFGAQRPASYPGKIVDLTVEGCSFPGGVREEIHELLVLILTEMSRRGYKPHPGWCWGGAFRATKRSDGTYTNTPSNHSAFLAIDINAPENSFGASTHAVPLWVVKLFEDYGFAWLGDDIKDWMHFQFGGSREDAKRMTEKARRELGEVDEMTPEQIEKLKQSAQRWEGALAYLEHTNDGGNANAAAPEDWDPSKKEGWRFARAAFNRPAAPAATG